MIKAGRVGVAAGVAAALALLSIIAASAAPQHLAGSAHATVAAAETTPSAVASSPTSLGHFFGKATSNLAHIVPAGPSHGAVVSAFATSSNPSHTKGHRHPHTAP